MKISRKAFLRYSSFIIASPVILFNAVNCNDNKTPAEGNSILAKDGFSSLMYSQPTITLSSDNFVKGKGYLIPKTASTSVDSPYVFKIIERNEKALFEDVYITIVDSIGNNIIVKNLAEGDMVLINPKNSFNQLRKINLHELKRRYLRTQDKFYGE